MYSVHIHVRHSHEYSSLLLPSFYPRHVEKLLECDPVPPDTYPKIRTHVLHQKYAGSTPLSTLRRVLEAETGIPLSVQNHFATGDAEEPHEEWGEGRERETATLDDAWAVTEEEDKEEASCGCLEVFEHCNGQGYQGTRQAKSEGEDERI